MPEALIADFTAQRAVVLAGGRVRRRRFGRVATSRRRGRGIASLRGQRFASRRRRVDRQRGESGRCVFRPPHFVGMSFVVEEDKLFDVVTVSLFSSTQMAQAGDC